MERGNIEDLYPLSPAQQGILFHTLAAPESGVYFEQFPLAYDEGVDPDLFVAAWQKVVDRHPILRTSFLWEDLEAPVQVVHRKVQVPVERLDWSGRSAAEQQRDLDAFAVADRRRGFDLTRPPLLRLALFRCGETSYRVIWSHHHLLLDGWSVGLMMNELFTLYHAIAGGEGDPLPARRPYGDYVRWLRRRDAAAAADDEVYWRRALAGLRRPTPLLAPRASAALGPDYELRLRRLSPELTARLKAFAQRHRLTLITLVYGAWALYLARATGERDLVFGTATSGRSAALPGVDVMLGCLIHTLPVRVAADPDARLVPWLQALQANLVELRRHEHSPLLDILGWAEVPRGRQLFDSLVAFQSFPGEAAFTMTLVGVFQRMHYPLHLVATPDPVLTLRLGFEPDRLSIERALGVLSDLETLLAAMAKDPDGALGSLTLPGAAEGQRLAAEKGEEPEPRPASRIAPRTDTERAIAAVWRQALGIDEVGVEDDFFDLGGHSLLLLRLADRVRSALGKELPLAPLLVARTVADMAAVADESLQQPVLTTGAAIA